MTAMWSTLQALLQNQEMTHAVTQEHYPKVIYPEMFVDKKAVKFQVDSGPSVNVIPVKFVSNKKFEPTTKTLQMWNNNTKATGFLSINSPQSEGQKKVLCGIPCH